MSNVDPSYLDALVGAGDYTLAATLLGIDLSPVAQATGGPPSSPTTVGGLDPTQSSGKAILSSILRDAGLSSPEAEQYVSDVVTSGGTIGEWQARLNADLYDTGSTIGKIVAQRYPEIQGVKANGYKPITVGEAQATRDQLTNVLHTYLPKGMYDSPDQLAQFISNGKSPSELNDELKMHAADAYEWANAQGRDSAVSEMQRLYGVGASSPEVLASYIDPGTAQNVLAQREAAARIAASSQNSGFGQLGQSEAQQLAGMGVTDAQTRAGFGQLYQQRELGQALPGEVGAGVDRATQLAAQFGGDAAAQEALARQAAARLAVFGGRGSFATNKEGIVGIGTAQSA